MRTPPKEALSWLRSPCWRACMVCKDQGNEHDCLTPKERETSSVLRQVLFGGALRIMRDTDHARPVISSVT